MDELETSVSRAIEKLAAMRAEKARLVETLRALGKEIDGLAGQIEAITSGQKVDPRTKKRLEARLRTIAEKLGQ